MQIWGECTGANWTLKRCLSEQCSTLQMYIVRGRTIAWLIIMPSVDKLEALHTYDICAKIFGTKIVENEHACREWTCM